jgi:BASS family bile acid:Na+ symporter
VAAWIHVLTDVSLVIFMVGSLLDMGLRLDVREALDGLKNVRLVSLTVVCGFFLSPAIGYVVARIVPLAQPYATGLELLAMVPCAPFLPMVVDRARGDSAYAAVMMLLTCVITVFFMPVAVPALTRGLSAEPWTIAKPLLFFLIVPLAIGTFVRSNSPHLANRIHVPVKAVSAVATIAVLVLAAVSFGRDSVLWAGGHAFLAQIAFFGLVITATYTLGFGLPERQRSVLTLGMATRNVGASFAPLFAIPGVDRRAIVMVAMALPMQLLASFLAARWLSHRVPTAGPGAPKAGATRIRAGDPFPIGYRPSYRPSR